jgi:hypothetical protein
MNLLELGWNDVDWIGLGGDRNRWRALVNWGRPTEGFSSGAQLYRVGLLSWVHETAMLRVVRLGFGIR